MSVTAAQGFVASGIACGIKASGDPDLSLVATATGQPVVAAAVFTSNKSTAAPVVVSRQHLEASGGVASAVVLNSGNANAATGANGKNAAERMCRSVADELAGNPEHVLVCSTGLIGIPLPVERIEAAASQLVASRSVEGGPAAARAILTTDTHAKEIVIRRGGCTIGGMAKGAAMLAPNMATMLAVLTTDAAIAGPKLQQALLDAVATSFNALSVDGCTSTNDTVIVLASGLAGSTHEDEFRAGLAEACADLAAQMAGDAEGATKVIRLNITGARSDYEAAVGARKVAESQLCKCSWYGCDPYWGRIASELGSAGIDYDADRLTVAYGGVVVAKDGVAVPHDEAAVRAHMAERHLTISADLGLAAGIGTILTNDLTHAYVDENMGTS